MLGRPVCTLTTFLIALSAISAQQNNPDLPQTLSRISASVITGESTELLRQLTDDIGARLVGSPAYERAVEWAAAKFQEAGLLRRQLMRGSVTIEAEWQNEVTGPVQVSNVVAEIAGSELAREWVLLGAHLDSWDLGTGAQDNGTGVVMVLEAARAIASLGKAPRRSIRFALWAAEEPGPPGSAMFIKRHATEFRIAWLS